MKPTLKRLGVFAICTLTLFCGSACGKHLFRDVNLGMSAEQVAKAEEDSGDPYIMESGAYLYTGVTYLDMTGTAVYSFSDADELNSILFMADEAYGTTDAFNAVYDLMTEAYGDPAYQNSNYDADIGADVTTVSWRNEDSSINAMLIWVPDTSLTIYLVPLSSLTS